MNFSDISHCSLLYLSRIYIFTEMQFTYVMEIINFEELYSLKISHMPS